MWAVFMCMTLYVATDIALPRIPWTEAAPPFNTQELTEPEAIVPERFSKRNVLFLGEQS